MGVTFQPEPTPLPGGGWDMHDGAPRLNVTTANAAAIFERLDVPFDESGSIPAGDILGRAMVANVGRDDIGFDPVTDQSPGGAQWTDCGRRAGYFGDRMERLAEVATAAAELGVDVQWM